MKGTLGLLPFHLRMLPYPFGSSRGLRTCIQPCKQERHRAATGMHSLLLTKENLQTRIKPLSNASVRHIRRQNTHTAGGAGLEPAARKHVVPKYLPLDNPPPVVTIENKKISLVRLQNMWRMPLVATVTVVNHLILIAIRCAQPL
jgi:hypothetical protein